LADIQLICEPSITPALQQQGNRCLMDWAGHQNLSSQDLAAFNCCQLAHRVYFLSDIMDGGSHSLCNLILLPPASPSMSSWHWPWAATVQTDWAIWQCLLPQLAAITLLGPWLKSPHLHAFIPFDPTMTMAFIVWPGSFWQTYCPLNPHATWWLLTLFPFSNSRGTTNALLFCMYPPLVQK